MLAAGLLVASVALAADYPVTHVHVRRDQPGELQMESDGIRYTETTKHKNPHEYRWTWNDIQKVVLQPDSIEITTYKDVKWLAGRDQRFLFRGKGLDAAWPLLRDVLPRRVVADIATLTPAPPLLELPAKRLEGRGGHEGTLRIAADSIIFESATSSGSHTWLLKEVENISSSDPLELTIASLGTDYRLQLKQTLPEAVYNDLWRKLNVRSNH